MSNVLDNSAFQVLEYLQTSHGLVLIASASVWSEKIFTRWFKKLSYFLLLKVIVMCARLQKFRNSPLVAMTSWMKHNMIS